MEIGLLSTSLHTIPTAQTGIPREPHFRAQFGGAKDCLTPTPEQIRLLQFRRFSLRIGGRTQRDLSKIQQAPELSVNQL
jgi:hypothetical protein